MRARNNIIAYILSGVVTLIIFILLLLTHFIDADFKFGWIEAEAQSVDVTPTTSDLLPGHQIHYTYTDCIISYEVDGKIYEHQRRFDNSDPYAHYTTLPIKYNPKKPEEYIIASSSSEKDISLRTIFNLIVLLLIIITDAVAVIVNVKRYKKHKAEKTETEQGYKLNGV